MLTEKAGFATVLTMLEMGHLFIAFRQRGNEEFYMRRAESFLLGLFVVLLVVNCPLSADPIADDIVFMTFASANGPALDGYLTGEYNFDVYGYMMDASGNLSVDLNNHLGQVSVWCLTPFARTYRGDYVPFAIGEATEIGQLHDVAGVTTSEAQDFYRDASSMVREFYDIGDTSLRDDLQAAIWERRDMIEGPMGTKSVDSFNLNADDYQPGTPLGISQYGTFSSLIGGSGIIDIVYTPLDPSAVVADADVLFGSFGYAYDHRRQEFGFIRIPEPATCFLLGAGLVALGIRRRRRK
jgi:hypothetical protein